MNTHHRIITSAAVALALAAGAAPAAARPTYLGGAENPNIRDGRQRLASVTTSSDAPAPATVVRITPSSGGFDWGDVGIGALGGIALSVLGLGSALAVSHRNPRRGDSATA